jgi:hypothetical protein
MAGLRLQAAQIPLVFCLWFLCRKEKAPMPLNLLAQVLQRQMDILLILASVR